MPHSVRLAAPGVLVWSISHMNDAIKPPDRLVSMRALDGPLKVCGASPGRSFGLTPLDPDHPLNDPTPTWVHAATKAMLGLMQRICGAARYASTQPETANPTGWYHVGVLINAEGMVMCTGDGVPIVLPSPQYVAAIDLESHAVLFVSQTSW